MKRAPLEGLLFESIKCGNLVSTKETSCFDSSAPASTDSRV